jgi:hypothetical protein
MARDAVINCAQDAGHQLQEGATLPVPMANGARHQKIVAGAAPIDRRPVSDKKGGTAGGVAVPPKVVAHNVTRRSGRKQDTASSGSGAVCSPKFLPKG